MQKPIKKRPGLLTAADPVALEICRLLGLPAHVTRAVITLEAKQIITVDAQFYADDSRQGEPVIVTRRLGVVALDP